MHNEAGSAPLRTPDADSTTVGGDYLVRNGEAQPCSLPCATRAGAIGAVETIEDVRKGIWRDAFARIGDRHLYLASLLHGTDHHRAARRGELDGIVDQVAEHLRQPVPVALQRREALRQRQVQIHARLESDRLELVTDTAEESRHIDRGKLEVGCTGVETG